MNDKRREVPFTAPCRDVNCSNDSQSTFSRLLQNRSTPSKYTVEMILIPRLNTVHLKPRWPPIRKGPRSRRSYGTLGHSVSSLWLRMIFYYFTVKLIDSIFLPITTEKSLESVPASFLALQVKFPVFCILL